MSSREAQERIDSAWSTLNDALSLIDSCNCGNEKNSQLVSRKNAEIDLKRVREEISGKELIISGLQIQKDELQIQKKKLEEDKKNLYKLIEEGGKLLAKVQDERDGYKNKWWLSEKEVKRLTELSSDLGKKLDNKDQTIKQQEKEIIKLKAQLGLLSPEEVLSKKIASEEKELDNLISGLSLPRQTIKKLCDAYEKLGLAR